jgi:FkbH-like protein
MIDDARMNPSPSSDVPGASTFAENLLAETRTATKFGEVLGLHRKRMRAQREGHWRGEGLPIRIGIVGGCTLRPLADLIEHFVAVYAAAPVEVWCGDFDSYVSEVLDPESELYAFKPNVVLILPSESRCRFTGSLNADIEEQEAHANAMVDEILGLCKVAHEHTGAEIVLANFRLPGSYDPGPLRQSSLAFPYGYRKYVNARLGRKAPRYAHILDVEFVANRLGTAASADIRTWFESKQPYSVALTVDVAREAGLVVAGLRKPPKKVVVLDLDNTLWGGVVGDDGIEGIEIGSTSPRGEAFRHFQDYLLSLTKRGILLAVCSKNDQDKAAEPFEKHPEMVLRMPDIANFKASWGPKSENIRQIASELNLGLDSLVFVDDNPAEIEIVRQFVPQVTSVWVGDDPSEFVAILESHRLFEVSAITGEDVQRAAQYKQEAERKALLESTTDMDAYLSSLEMVGQISEFKTVDAPRISQLINKSNQFNLTTRRRTEAEVLELIACPDKRTFTIRLADRFGDHGLIAVVVGEIQGEEFVLDTWLMSCRVLKRQVEEETLNEIVRLANLAGCRQVVGVYRPTEKNGMVRDHYCGMGFSPMREDSGGQYYSLSVADYVARPTKIAVQRRAYGSD